MAKLLGGILVFLAIAVFGVGLLRELLNPPAGGGPARGAREPGASFAFLAIWVYGSCGPAGVLCAAGGYPEAPSNTDAFGFYEQALIGVAIIMVAGFVGYALSATSRQMMESSPPANGEPGEAPH
jgi:hypothetical protein